MFLAPWFFIAGLIFAAGPIIIHLLNRRRYRTIEWGAMEFLREALVRSRRLIQFSDLLLLALRMLVMVAFGAALARPFLGGAGSASRRARAGPLSTLAGSFINRGTMAQPGTTMSQPWPSAARPVIKGPRAGVWPAWLFSCTTWATTWPPKNAAGRRCLSWRSLVTVSSP